jgi:ParB family chromosome partitioning protein
MTRRKLDAGQFLATSTITAELEQEVTRKERKISELEQTIQTLNNQLQLLGQESVAIASKNEIEVALEDIEVDPQQARRWFEPIKMEALVASIKSVGIQTRLWVRRLPDGKYRLIAGERRLRAAYTLLLATVPVLVFEVDEATAVMLSLLENNQREDISPLEETMGTLRLLTIRLKKTQDEVCSLLYQMKHKAEGRAGENVSPQDEEIVEAVFVASSRVSWASFIKTRLPLLKLPKDVLTVFNRGELDYTKALALARVANDSIRAQILEEAIRENLSFAAIKERINVYRPSKTASLKGEFRSLLQKKSTVWNDPKKSKKIRELLEQLQRLIDESSDD